MDKDLLSRGKEVELTIESTKNTMKLILLNNSYTMLHQELRTLVLALGDQIVTGSGTKAQHDTVSKIKVLLSHHDNRVKYITKEMTSS